MNDIKNTLLMLVERQAFGGSATCNFSAFSRLQSVMEE